MQHKSLMILEGTPSVRRTHNDQRKARIDELLLFLSSGLGILFSMIQASVGGVSSVILFVPLLLLGLALPIYVGYLKGAVQDRYMERIRG